MPKTMYLLVALDENHHITGVIETDTQELFNELRELNASETTRSEVTCTMLMPGGVTAEVAVLAENDVTALEMAGISHFLLDCLAGRDSTDPEWPPTIH